MTQPVPVFIPSENLAHLGTHWRNTQEAWGAEIAETYTQELSELVSSWSALSDDERGLLVLACDLIKNGVCS